LKPICNITIPKKGPSKADDLVKEMFRLISIRANGPLGKYDDEKVNDAVLFIDNYFNLKTGEQIKVGSLTKTASGSSYSAASAFVSKFCEVIPECQALIIKDIFLYGNINTETLLAMRDSESKYKSPVDSGHGVKDSSRLGGYQHYFLNSEKQLIIDYFIHPIMLELGLSDKKEAVVGATEIDKVFYRWMNIEHDGELSHMLKLYENVEVLLKICEKVQKDLEGQSLPEGQDYSFEGLFTKEAICRNVRGYLISNRPNKRTIIFENPYDTLARFNLLKYIDENAKELNTTLLPKNANNMDEVANALFKKLCEVPSRFYGLYFKSVNGQLGANEFLISEEERCIDPRWDVDHAFKLLARDVDVFGYKSPDDGVKVSFGLILEALIEKLKEDLNSRNGITLKDKRKAEIDVLENFSELFTKYFFGAPSVSEKEVIDIEYETVANYIKDLETHVYQCYDIKNPSKSRAKLDIDTEFVDAIKSENIEWCEIILVARIGHEESHDTTYFYVFRVSNYYVLEPYGESGNATYVVPANKSIEQLTEYLNACNMSLYTYVRQPEVKGLYGTRTIFKTKDGAYMASANRIRLIAEKLLSAENTVEVTQNARALSRGHGARKKLTEDITKSIDVYGLDEASLYILKVLTLMRESKEEE
jgi:hypothetical protein